jgi:hypothetical protein
MLLLLRDECPKPSYSDLARRSTATLQHYTVALGELDQLLQLLGRGVTPQVELQADLAEADWRILRDAERAAEVEVAFGEHRRVFQVDLQRGCHGFERDAGAGDECLEQHVARAGLQAAAAGGGMQPGFDERPPGIDATGDAFAHSSLRFQRDERLGGFFSIRIFQGRLQRFQLFGIHIHSRYWAFHFTYIAYAAAFMACLSA